MKNATPTPGWNRRPLCRHYVFAVLHTGTVRVLDFGEPVQKTVCWGYGWLPNGEAEALGAWTACEPNRAIPHEAFLDLYERGVERIRFAVFAMHDGPGHALAVTFPGALAVTSVSQIPVAAISERLRRVGQQAEVFARDLQSSLVKSIRRKGSFATEAAALDFVAWILWRAERRMDRDRAIAKVRPRLDSGSQMSASGI